MPAFTSVNVDPEESVDEEFDNTKEIQVDDALKLFQTALKLHAQGPQFFDEASDAYGALFEAEIFQYPESKTEYERAEQQPSGSSAIEPAFSTSLELSTNDPEGLANSLNQALYLSYKNRGQFSLDRIKNRARAAQHESHAVFEEQDVQDDARSALQDFNTSIDRDPSDAELWRRTARLAAFLKSSRISRYCLEAAIELDDDPAVVEVEPPSLAEGYAGAQLKKQLELAGDSMALSHPIMKPFRERELPALLRRYLDPLPFLPDFTKKLAVPKSDVDDVEPGRLVLSVPSATWAHLGLALAQFVADEGYPGQAIFVELPEATEDDDVQMEIDKQLQGGDAALIITDSQSAKSKDGIKPEALEKVEELLDQATEAHVIVTETTTTRVKDHSVALPSRKRSQSAAGMEVQEEEPGDNKRSKRTRRRDTAAEDVMDTATLLATQLQPFQAADKNLFQTTKNILENLGLTDQAMHRRIAEILDLCASDERNTQSSFAVMNDMRNLIAQFDEATAKAFLGKKEAPALGLSAFLEHAKSKSRSAPEAPVFDASRGLRAFVKDFNAGWLTIHELAFEWVKAMSRSYTSSKWPEALKDAVLQVVSQLDESLMRQTTKELERIQADVADVPALSEIHELIHMLFELHVDVYEQITNPNAVVERSAALETKARMERWFDLASAISHTRTEGFAADLTLRFLWAAVLSSTMDDAISRDHTLACWNSLRVHLAHDDIQAINLPNNVIMSEVSVAAADREISKLTTMDFFLGLFNEEIDDPLALIDTLEPVLNPEAVHVPAPANTNDRSNGDDVETETGVAISQCASQELRDLWKFLAGSSTELRLFLWSRLGDAYGTIDYPTKQFSCFLKGIEMIVGDLELDSYVTAPADSRRRLFATMLQSLDDLLIQALHLALNNNSSFDIIDDEHLRTTASALAKVSCILHTGAMFEDEVRIGMTQAPASGATYNSFVVKIREMQVRTWCLQYTIFKVGVYQNTSAFPKPENDLADFLAAVHQVLGLRKYCKASNKIFLKMMRVELLKQRNIENWEDYLGQVLYDLHGLKLGVGMWDVQDHGCPAEKLEKRQAMLLVEKIMMLANRMSMKDLLKSDLKTTIEHIQQSIGSTKSTPQMIYNLRNFTEYLRKPIHPLRLYQAMTGSVTLDAVHVRTPESALAEHGWFFLLGMIALTKFKAVDLNRRQTPGATDDLRMGATFLRLQLQFTPDRWDAWFRLAECFDYELDEMVLWTADKMNKERAELVKFQRNAIHCYTLALSYSRSWLPDSLALVSQEDEDALYDLYHNFAMRLYASSREPFAMEPFEHTDHERFCIQSMGDGTYKKLVHEQMSDYKVWKYAANLFSRAMAGRPKDWKNPYMISKCLWKMYQKPVEELDAKDKVGRPSVARVIAALEKTIEVVSALPKPRHGQDPILEPHYKIVSIVHKLVMRGSLKAQLGADILHRQPYAPHGDDPIVTDSDDWETYMIRSLRLLRDKDKSNWQHRIIIRHARILFEGDQEGENANAADLAENGGSYVAAKAAFMVLRENMVTKTMVMNVWKCDAERAGRHHVYTEQYIRLLACLLSVMNDRINMEAVLRRIRKKSLDFYHFNDLWQSCVLTYVKLLRSSYQITLSEEDVFRSLTAEEFDVAGEKIAAWVNTPAAEGHPALSAMKDAVELKKLNANLMKAVPIDDLINDCYSLIYTHVGPLAKPEAEKENTEEKAANGKAETSSAPKEAAASTLGSLLAAQKEPAILGSLRATSEQPEKTVSNAGDADKKPRRLGVRRADILRKAEQAVLRAAEGPPKPGETRGKARIGSVSSGKKSMTPGAGVGEDGEDSADDGGAANGDDTEMHDVHMDRRANGGASDTSSPPASVHDSADDESDLSDVPPDYEDHIPPALMFPNLRKSVEVISGTSAANSPDESGDGSSTEDEETEMEGDMEVDVEVDAAPVGPQNGFAAANGAEMDKEEDLGDDVGDETEEEMA